jgi:putative PEP-CTERM system TPR-repeat lipoprotein
MNQSTSSVRLTLVSCAIASLFLAACHKEQQDHLARGKEMAAKQDHKGAVIELKNALQSDPQSAEARFVLGKELLAQGDPKGAEIELQKAYDGKYDPELVVPMLVKAQLLQGQIDKVSAQVSKAELKSPAANAELQTLLGVALFGQGRLDDALNAFSAAEKLAPDYAEAQLGEARIKAARSDIAGAIQIVTAVVAKHPALAEALVLKGDLARAKADLPGAIEAYKAAVASDPRSFLGRLNLAGAYVASGQPDLAQAQVDELKKVAPKHPGVTYMDALIAFNKKDYARANDAISVSIAGAPKSGMARLLAGAIATATNQPAQAEANLTEALKINPGSIYARKLLTALYLRQRQPQKADEILQPALAAAPNDVGLISLAGEAALLKGDFTNASKFFDKAAKNNPTDANIRTQGAAVDFARGDEASGFAELEAASKASVNNPSPDIALVLARVQRKQYDQALTAWKTLEKRQPDNPLTYNLLAAIDMGRGDMAGTRKALEHAVELQPTYYPAVANLAALDMRDNKPEDARARLKALVAKDPTNMAGLLALAQFENSHGATSDVVVGLLKEAQRANPTSEQPISALAGFYVAKNDPKQALTIVQQALAASPNSPTYLDLAGQLLLQTGSGDQAVVTYRKLSNVNPESIDYQIRLGQAQVMTNQADAALATFSAVVKKRPDAYAAQATAVGTLLRAGKVEAATRLLGDIKQASPKSPALPELEGDVKLTSKQYADAAATYKKVLTQTPSSNLVIKIYSSMFLAGNVGDAYSFVTDWLKTHPKDVPIRLFDADLALRRKDYAHAVQGYRVALDVSPSDPGIMNNLAWALWQQKDPQALTYAQKANAIAPGSPAIGDTLGWMLVEQGQTKRGLELLEKASAAAPQQLDISLHLAKAQIKDGRKDAARTTLQGLVKAAPDTPEGKESKDLMATL